MKTAEINKELQKNAIIISVLIGTIGTGLLAFIFELGIGTIFIIYFVIVAITFLGIKVSEDK
ncbi:hypothetical protein KAU33_15715 [Candidatus Dependentiae bacterium]|nr:hypothetical protein [Candidatus Dependentiae bacterium]